MCTNSPSQYGNIWGRGPFRRRAPRPNDVRIIPPLITVIFSHRDAPRTLVLAGSDSTSNAICKSIDILVHRNEVQDKLRTELSAAQERHGPHIPYDELVALPYLDAFCRETMRMFVYRFFLLDHILTTRLLASYPPVMIMMREWVHFSPTRYSCLYPSFSVHRET